MTPEFISHHSEHGFALLVLAKSIGSNRTLIGERANSIDLYTLKAADLAKHYSKVGTWDRNASWPDVLEDPERTALRMVLSRKAITKEALDVLERILNMNTRGKSSEQIRAEVIRLSSDLPKDHALKVVPPKYPDRGAAIAAYTAIRQAIYQLTKEHDMNTKPNTTKETSPTKASKKAADAAPVETKPVKKGGKPVVAEAAPVETKPAAAKEKAPKAAKDDGSFVTAGDAATAKTTEELGMHEESIRTKVLSVVMKSKVKGGVAFAALAEVAGDKTRGAIAYLLKRGYLAKA